MRKTKAEKTYDQVSAKFASILDEAFAKQFVGAKIETRFNIIVMAMISTPVDDKKLTVKQRAWIGGFSEGYYAASQILR